MSASPIENAQEWRVQPWMLGEGRTRGRWSTHEEAMDKIYAVFTVTTLSYDEAVMIYARSRGFIVDDAEMLSEPPSVR